MKTESPQLEDRGRQDIEDDELKLVTSAGDGGSEETNTNGAGNTPVGLGIECSIPIDAPQAKKVDVRAHTAYISQTVLTVLYAHNGECWKQRGTATHSSVVY